MMSLSKQALMPEDVRNRSENLCVLETINNDLDDNTPIEILPEGVQRVCYLDSNPSPYNGVLDVTDLYARYLLLDSEWTIRDYEILEDDEHFGMFTVREIQQMLTFLDEDYTDDLKYVDLNKIGEKLIDKCGDKPNLIKVFKANQKFALNLWPMIITDKRNIYKNIATYSPPIVQAKDLNIRYEARYTNIVPNLLAREKGLRIKPEVVWHCNYCYLERNRTQVIERILSVIDTIRVCAWRDETIPYEILSRKTIFELNMILIEKVLIAVNGLRRAGIYHSLLVTCKLPNIMDLAKNVHYRFVTSRNCITDRNTGKKYSYDQCIADIMKDVYDFQQQGEVAKVTPMKPQNWVVAKMSEVITDRITYVLATTWQGITLATGVICAIVSNIMSIIFQTIEIFKNGCNGLKLISVICNIVTLVSQIAAGVGAGSLLATLPNFSEILTSVFGELKPDEHMLSLIHI